VFSQNFPVSGTSIPLNLMEDCGAGKPGAGSNWYRTCGFKSKHPGGASFALGDASVRFIPATIDYRIYNEIGSRAGNEVVIVP
jgi:hypothetical protein